MAQPVEDVAILNRSGEKLCSIHCPQSISNYIPIALPPVIFNLRKKWTNPEVIVYWAWHQAFETNETYKELGATSYLTAPSVKCVACGTLSIKPVNIKTLFGDRTLGVQCNNEACSIYHVTVPYQMLLHLKEVPTEYIPPGFYVKP